MIAANTRLSYEERDAKRVVVVGATRNFFKVGHTTLRTLATRRPDVRLRLGIPDVANAGLAVKGIDVELVAWDPRRPKSLDSVLSGCTGMLMVPPIDRRFETAKAYIDAARHAGVSYILCLGVQHDDERLILGREANAVAKMLGESGIPSDTLRLPMFLENLLYQIPSISRNHEFRFPVSPDAPFSYLTCGDLGEVFAAVMLDDTRHGNLGETHWTASESLTCRRWARLLSET